MNNTTINLKDNLHITLNEVPKNAKPLVAGTLPFFSEDESAWYVIQKGDKQFKDYGREGSLVTTAQASLRSAIEKLSGKGCNPKKVKFRIFTTSN